MPTKKKIENSTPPPPKEPAKHATRKPLLFSVSIKEKIFFAKHLSVMLKAGIPIHEAIAALEEQAATASLKHILRTCMADVAGGELLATGLEKFPGTFDAFFVNVVRVGETSGTLSESLLYIATQLEKTREIQSKIRAALVYPIIVFVGALGMGGYLAFFILPKLLPLFTSLNTELPTTTKILLASTNFMIQHWPWVIGAIIVVVIAFLLALRIRKFRKFIHRSFLIIPLIRTLSREIQSTQFALILGTLLTAGVKVVPAMRITANSLKNLVFSDFLNEVANHVERGETIGSQLKVARKLFSRTTTSMIEVGERTGRLSESALTLAEFSEKEVDNLMKNLSALIEPFVLILVGVIVGFIAFSIISPIYQLTEAVSI